MSALKLSSLAEKCFAKLNSMPCSIESAALAMYEDTTLSQSLRNAYYEVYKYCLTDY